jgi:protoporphyrinogen oxidase
LPYNRKGEDLTIAIIGAGLAGLSAAHELNNQKYKFLLLEKSSEVGGKLKTIPWSNFKLDLGFQVLLSAYPSLSGSLTPEDYTSLNPCYFEAGTILLKDGKQYRLADPFRAQRDFWESIFCPLVSWSDKFKTLDLKQELAKYKFPEVLSNEVWSQESGLSFLKSRGFSEKFVNNFARPFFGGVFGDDSLETKASCLAFCFKAFAEGKVFIPAQGVGELTKLLANKLPPQMLRTGANVIDIQKVAEDGSFKIILDDGKYHLASNIILATDLETTCKLLGQTLQAEPRVGYFNLYFVSQTSLYTDKKIFLNCNESKLINNGVQISNVSAKLTPSPGQEHLISVTILRNDIPAADLPKACISELEQLFPAAKGQFKFLKTFEISGPGSLLKQDPEHMQLLAEATRSMQIKLPQNVLLAGELVSGNCSQETAIQSGKRAANKIIGKFS